MRARRLFADIQPASVRPSTAATAAPADPVQANPPATIATAIAARVFTDRVDAPAMAATAAATSGMPASRRNPPNAFGEMNVAVARHDPRNARPCSECVSMCAISSATRMTSARR